MKKEDGQALYPIDTQRYYDSINVLAPAMRKHLKEGLRGFKDENWSVKMLSGYSVRPELLYSGEGATSRDFLMFCIVPMGKDRVRRAF